MASPAPPGPAPPPISQQRLTATRLIAAFNAMDPDTATSIRSPDCVRYIHPLSLGHPPQSVETTNRSLNSLKTVFHNFELRVDDLIEDLPARKICMWLTARADTEVGEYRNEYVWNLEFDEGGELIVGWREFVDAGMKDFFPKLQAAYREKAARRAGAEGGGVEGGAS